jgi:hypothetical protein
VVKPPAAVAFTAYASGLSNLVVMACFLPIIVAGGANLVFHPQAPVWGRVMGAMVIFPILVYYAVALRLYTLRCPVIDIDERGLLWRRWSDTRIPWSAIAGWKVRSTLGQRFVTVWLADRSAYPSTTINGWLAIGNRWLGYGDLTLATAGTDGHFEDLAAAISAHAHTCQG